MYKFLIALCCATALTTSAAFGLDLTAEWEALGRTYILSCQSNNTLDIAPLRGLYTDDAVEVFFSPRAAPRVTVGAAAIEENAERNFRRMRQGNVKSVLRYKIVDRQEQNGTVVDRGFYRIQGMGPHGEMDEIGRVVIVQRKGADGRWRQQFHGNVPATREEFEAAEAIALY
ncbi:YybH family protein [Roseiterribacter gracilis]|uniref:DUF4440 domain-containing protein n=1 Tax=Roseiterribacter gracilis TaxID=2812848 RepID=A0A8S8X8C8_9PROT|nr:hypothetical protein TMPK1_23450 [Rhodospirillales bacterium TMPK1]